MRTSKEVKAIAEKNKDTMLKVPLFELWVSRHLRKRDRLDEYRKAYEYLHKNEVEDDEPTLI